MKSNGIYYVYIKKTDGTVWNNWKNVRHPEIGGFSSFSSGPGNKIKSNIAIYKARAFEKVKIVPSAFKEPESYLDEVDKRYHKILCDQQLIWFFNETWSESHLLFSAKLSLFFFLFLEQVRSELMIYDALDREESCGGHFREEYQTTEGEALRDDENYTFVSAWEYKGEGLEPELHKEDLNYKEVTPTQRSYK